MKKLQSFVGQWTKPHNLCLCSHSTGLYEKQKKNANRFIAFRSIATMMSWAESHTHTHADDEY